MISLKTTLLINGVSSAVTGLLLVLLAGPIATLFGVAATDPFIGVGLFLLVFGVFVLITSLRLPINPRAVRLISTLDMLWVVASIVAVVGLAATISLFGLIAIAAVAVWVAAMAYLQTKGLSAFP